MPARLIIALSIAAPVLAAAEPAFEVVSIKYTGTPMDHTSLRDGRSTMYWRPVEYKGVRLSGDAPLLQMIEFACSPLVTPFRYEYPDWMRFEYYQIDAIAPPGTTLDAARAMLRKALAERLGLQSHVTDRQTPVYYLQRSTGALKLLLSTEPDPPGGSRQSTWHFKQRSATLAAFSRFLAGITGREVVDKTGLDGRYNMDVDWSAALQSDPQNDGPGIAIAGVKSLGLRLAPAREMRRVLIIDRANKRPTPNL